MTPAEFVATYGSWADLASGLTGLNRWTILTQWAFETGWASPNSGVPFNNLAGIRNPAYPLNGAGFSIYPDLGAFVNDYSSVLHQDNMAAALAAAGQPVETQLLAFGHTAWVGYNQAAEAAYAAHLLEVWGSSLAPLSGQSSPQSQPVAPSQSPSPSGGLSPVDRDFLYAQLVKIAHAVGVNLDTPPWVAPAVRTYTVKPGDSLWQIAQDYLGNGERWTEIRGQVPPSPDAPPAHIFAGNVLILPNT